MRYTGARVRLLLSRCVMVVVLWDSARVPGRQGVGENLIQISPGARTQGPRGVPMLLLAISRSFFCFFDICMGLSA